MPNRFRAAYREGFAIASGYGDISSERAYLRTKSLSCVRADGSALEVKIQGSVYGEDGKVGMRGRLVTKQGQMLANALMAGVVSGIGGSLSTATGGPLADAIKTVRGIGSRQLVVFSDPACGFCKRSEPELEKLQDVTVYTRCEFCRPFCRQRPQKA